LFAAGDADCVGSWELPQVSPRWRSARRPQAPGRYCSRPGGYGAITKTSARRLRLRPLRVVFEATGAASPALVVVGFLLMTRINDIPWDDYTLAIPAFLTIVLMPFTFSITNGIGAGFVSYAVLRLTGGRAREVHPLLWVVAVLFVAYFAIDWVEQLTGVK
jgi:hypothetical protein